MPRNRTLSPDFWTWEAVVDCAPMTRLLFVGLWTFADDHGVQPLRPRTIRMQVFPGDTIENDNMRAMLDELARRWPACPSDHADGHEAADVGAAREAPADRPDSASSAPVAQAPCPEEDHNKAWSAAIVPVLRRSWPGGPPADTARWIEQWIAAAYDMRRDVLPALETTCQAVADCRTPPGLHIAMAVIAATHRPGQPAVTM
jgi:hypothetical protein